MLHRLLASVSFGALALIVTACGSSSSSLASPSLTAMATTETFQGTVDVGGISTNPFTVGVSGGQVNVTLTAAGPPSTIFMGLAVGGVSSGVCTPLSGAAVIAQGGSAAQLSGTAAAGSYCVMVYDVGNQSAPVDYSVTVSHF